MVKTEILADGKLIRHYSDTSGMALLQADTGLVYSEAIDPNPTKHTYEETPSGEEYGDDLTDTEALSIITGGASDA